MKTIKILFITLFAAGFGSCIDENMNVDPGAVSANEVKPEWSLNASISGAQMDPHIAERMFVLTWKSAARFDRGGDFSLGADNNEWVHDYASIGWGGAWLRDAYLAVDFARQRIEREGAAYPYYNNVLQMARIWRAYLLAQFADGFGPMPTTGSFAGESPVFESQETVYTFILDELKEAAAAIDLTINMSDFDPTLDLFYAGDLEMWRKYANSLRMRMAMRLSEVSPALAQTHFEEAAQGPFIETLGDMAQVVENPGWSPFSGVMSRTWNNQAMSKTFFNLVVGLGGIEFPQQAGISAQQFKDPYAYLGRLYADHFPTTTNDPSRGFFFDGIPQFVDPRAPLLYHITGYRDQNGIYPADALTEDGDAATHPENFEDLVLFDANSNPVATITTTHTWSTVVAGVWDVKSTMCARYLQNHNFPSLSNAYRTSANKRVFFGPWESFFLLAEAAYRGWNVPQSAQQYYEAGIAASFEYHGVTAQLNAYLTSEDYNRVGTSVSFSHTDEAVGNVMLYSDGYTGLFENTLYEYPENSIYNGGATNNDVLTKIITQKYIAQVPWLPLEAWCDHRRLGLPFFENQAVEVAYNTQTQVPLTPATSTECRWEFYPKRYRYPVSWVTSDPDVYARAQQLLGGEDRTTTPLWWSH